MTSPYNESVYRLIDANADRLGEALRVVSDAVRFILDDEALAARWREVRSRFWSIYSSTPSLQSRGLASRDSGGDVGRTFESSPHHDIVKLAVSNIHRAQESLRTLEEALRTFDTSTAAQITELRYICYELEPPTMASFEKATLASKLDFGLYVVLGNEFSCGRDFYEVASKAIAGGAGAIQLRDKQLSKRELLDWARRLRELTAETGATFIINDHIDIALAVGADGVHLGQGDFPVADARRVLGPGFIIGASTHTVDQAKRAVADGCSYFNVGPLFATATKQGGHPPVGPEAIEEIALPMAHPFTVMGGMKLSNIDQALERGARRIAVVTAVTAADDIEAAARALSERIASYSSSNSEAPL